MRGTNGIVVIRSVIAVLLLALGIAAISDGRVVVGAILCLLAVMNVLLTVTMRRRRARFLSRLSERAVRTGGSPGSRR